MYLRPDNIVAKVLMVFIKRSRDNKIFLISSYHAKIADMPWHSTWPPIKTKVRYNVWNFWITATSPKLWLENQKLATWLKWPSYIHFWSQKSRLTFESITICNRMLPTDQFENVLLLIAMGGERGEGRGDKQRGLERMVSVFSVAVHKQHLAEFIAPFATFICIKFTWEIQNKSWTQLTSQRRPF